MRDQYARFFVSALTAAALSAGNVFCYATGFGIEVSVRKVLLSILASAVLLSAIGLMRRHAALVSGILLGVFALYVFCRRVRFAESFLESAAPLAEQYQKAFGLFPDTDPAALALAGTAPDLFLSCAGLLLVFFSVRVVMGRHPLFPLMLMSILLLVLPLLVVETQPSVWSIALLSGSYLILLMDREGLFHRGSGRDRTALYMVLPAAALVLLIGLWVHPDTYERPASVEALQIRVEHFFERHTPLVKDARNGSVRAVLPSDHETLGNLSWNEQLEEADLGTAGPRRDTATTVMEVRAQTDGRLYLRGNSFAYYGENAWRTADPAGDEAAGVMPQPEWTTDADADARVFIQTERHSRIYYIPYIPTELPADAEVSGDAYLDNPGGALSYEIPYADANTGIPGTDESYESYVKEVYLEVPEETREALSDILEQIPEGENEDETAEIVAEFVRNSAVYSKDTAAMPEGEEFVSWFLHDGDTGYCVHFASAAAVLLRCMGVPARFVNGYVCDVTAGEWTVVSQQDAHSWVEYYVDGEGWKYLDPTPAVEEEADAAPVSENVNEDPDRSEAGESEAVSEASSQMSSPESSENEETGSSSRRRFPARTALLVLLAALALWNLLLRFTRHLRFTRGTNGTRLLGYYHEMRRIGRLTGTAVPEEAETLAEKARFSRHPVTKGELADLMFCYQKMRRQLLSDRRIAIQLFRRFLLAI